MSLKNIFLEFPIQRHLDKWDFMITSITQHVDFCSRAHADVSEAIKRFLSDVVKDDLEQARKEVEALGCPFTNLPNQDVLETCSEILEWIETNDNWPICRNGYVAGNTVMQFPQTRYFLCLLVSWFDDICPTTLPLEENEMPEVPVSPEEEKHGASARFAALVGEQVPVFGNNLRNHTVAISSTWSSNINMRGFFSWLVVDLTTNHVQIFVDDKALLNVAHDKKPWQLHGRIRCILHELGHMRTSMDHYYQTPRDPNTSLIHSIPKHELWAWTYADSVTGCISGLRARVKRILGLVEKEAAI